MFRLEKQVLDLSAHIALLTSELGEGMAQGLHKKLESASKGTQSYKHSNMQLTELKNSIGNVEHDMKIHFESFQKNLKFLRDKEEDNRRERADLLTQLQCSQDTEDFLRRKLEESCHHVYNLKLSEIKLQEQVNKLLDENKSLKYQARVRLKKKEEKDLQLTRPESTDNSADLVSKSKAKYNNVSFLYHPRLHFSLGMQWRCNPEAFSFLYLFPLFLLMYWKFGV